MSRIIRQRKPVFLIVLEGHNKTETHYFESLNRECHRVCLKPVSLGDTDLPNLEQDACACWHRCGLDRGNGDRVFLLVDDDASEGRKAAIAHEAEVHPNIEVVISSPAFENFLIAYFASPHPNCTSDQALAELQKKIPDFAKGKPYFQKLPAQGHQQAVLTYQKAIAPTIKKTITVAAMIQIILDLEKKD
jgi:hypothetical protein